MRQTSMSRQNISRRRGQHRTLLLAAIVSPVGWNLVEASASADGAQPAVFECRGTETGKIEGYVAEQQLLLDCEGEQCKTYFGNERFRSHRDKDGVVGSSAPHYFKFSPKDGKVQGVSSDPYNYFIGTCKRAKSVEDTLSKIGKGGAPSDARLDFSELSKQPAIQGEMSLHCRWMKTATLDAQGGASPTGEVQDGGGSPLNFLVLGGKLTIPTTDGNAQLHLVGANRANGAMFFVESTPSGNVVLWSFYAVSDESRLFFKQNNYTGGTPGRVTAWNHMGLCKASGGNGRPISK